jgi:hypothetical protein
VFFTNNSPVESEIMDGSNDSVDSNDLKRLKDNVLAEALKNFKVKFKHSTQSLVSNTNHSFEGGENSNNKQFVVSPFHNGGSGGHHFRNASHDTNNNGSRNHSFHAETGADPASSSHSSGQFKNSNSGHFYALPIQKLHHQRSSLVEPRNRQAPGAALSNDADEEEDAALSWIGKTKRDVVGGGAQSGFHNDNSQSKHHRRNLSLPAVKNGAKKPTNRIFPVDDDTASSTAPSQRSSAVSDVSSAAFPDYSHQRHPTNNTHSYDIQDRSSSYM